MFVSRCPPIFPSSALVCVAAVGLVVLGLVGCGEATSPSMTPAPTPEKLASTVRSHAAVLSRMNCSGCPDRWEPQPCDFMEGVLRAPGSIDPARCTVVQAVIGYPGLPERLPAAVTASVDAGKDALAEDSRHRNIDQALQIYAFGADLQRLGSVELWHRGLLARAAAVGWLADARPDDRWPAELLALEAAAPAPARVTDVALLHSYNRLRERGWSERSALSFASNQAVKVVRLPVHQQAEAVGQVQDALATTWPDATLPVDLVDTWQAAELVRSRSVRVALEAALARHKSCPASLDELVPAQIPTVPQGWTLDPTRCTPVQGQQGPLSEARTTPSAGALAAQP